ncbi:hypothetical protein LGT39_11955 [Demequina sp. TTPB684]|uniref:hypothetical protein n=1 Tax=unclassified Demequina TaxID=2620311 RepID=UPI001CF40414|nr:MULTISPECIES: hypothetical protein [unclassified Demequina]MCB2413556.1 hypothetical protein [Demequina sp. TTPB684]UPU87224.1 hypothetical protein LGT36_008030 [Demequina sp. TMPB413]
MMVGPGVEGSPLGGDRRNDGQIATRRVVLSHVAGWCVVAVAPFCALVGTYLFAQLFLGGSDDFIEMITGILWVAMYLLPVALGVFILGAIDIGFLLTLRRFTRWARWQKAAIPAALVSVIAMAGFSAYIAMTMYSLSGTGHYYAIAAGGAAVLGSAVFVSHMRYYRRRL